MPPSLREAPLIVPYGARRGQADRRTAAGPLTQSRLICLCKEGHRFEDLSPTNVTSDPKTILALSMSAKMISGSFEGAIAPARIITTCWEFGENKSLNPLHIFYFKISVLVFAALAFTSWLNTSCLQGMHFTDPKISFWITRFVWLLFGSVALSAFTALFEKALFPYSLEVLANMHRSDFKHLWSSSRRAKQVSPGWFGSGWGWAAEVPPRPE